MPPPGMRPFGWTIQDRGSTAGCSTGGKVGDISGRSHPCMYQLPCCRHLPDKAKAVTHTPSCQHLGTGMLHLPGESRALQPRGSSENHLQREHGTLSLMEGESLELSHPAGSTSITRWECCTPGEPSAEPGAQGGSGAAAGNSPAVYSSFSSPVPLPGINA